MTTSDQYRTFWESIRDASGTRNGMAGPAEPLANHRAGAPVAGMPEISGHFALSKGCPLQQRLCGPHVHDKESRQDPLPRACGSQSNSAAATQELETVQGDRQFPQRGVFSGEWGTGNASVPAADDDEMRSRRKLPHQTALFNDGNFANSNEVRQAAAVTRDLDRMIDLSDYYFTTEL